MALRNVLFFPDPRLRIKAEPVADFNGELQDIIDDMFETMYHDNGCGLAATQIYVPRRIIVMDLSPDGTQPLCLINPEILQRSGTERMREGCLSVPGIYEYVERAAKIQVRYQDRQGKTIEKEVDKLMAVCIQHETDHLEGILFIDKLSPLKQKLVKAKAEKRAKQIAKQRYHTL